MTNDPLSLRHFHQISGLLLLLLAWSVNAATHQVTPQDEWFKLLSGNGLNPGDELVLTAGTYSDPRLLKISHQGTKENPIIIRGEKGTVFQRPDQRQNSINIVGAQHLILRNLEITGGASGIRIYATGQMAASHITLENLHLHHIGGVGVTCNHDGNIYRGMVFRNNHIHHTGGHGEALYLGCNNKSDGTTPGYITGAIIEGNYIHHLNGPKISQGDGIELKDGSHGNMIRFNVIHDTRYPGITAYGTDGRSPNIIENNLIWNTGDNGIQVASEAIVRNNIISRAGGAGIRSMPHQSALPGDLLIEHNTFVSSRQSDIRISGNTGSPINIINNRIRSSSLRIENEKGIQKNNNSQAAKGAVPFAPKRVPAWTPDPTFHLLRFLESP